MTLRVNRRRMCRDDYLARLFAEGIAASPLGQSGILLERPIGLERLPGFQSGWVSVQDHGAQFVPAVLDVHSGMRVCDACAAPGGKTAHILEESDVTLTALDVRAARITKVRDTLRRLGLQAHLVVADAAKLPTWWDGQPYDRVLLDAPCSASGVVRRHPDSKWLRRDTDIDQFAKIQGSLLDALWQVVRPGGKLLYVTCSVFKSENEDVIASFIEKRRDAWVAPNLPPFDCAGRLMPSPHNDGFFYALLHKT